MENLKLLQLLESVLGKGKPTSGHNIAFFSPFISHYKPKLEININTDNNGQNPWHCWISDKKGRSILSLFKQLKLPKQKFEQLKKIIDTKDTVISSLLLSNNLVNILASSLATAFFYDLFGVTGIFYATILMTFLIEVKKNH